MRPTFAGQVSFHGMRSYCVGLVRDNHQAVFLSMVGYRTANKALWAALMEKRNTLELGKGVQISRLTGQYLHDEKALPELQMYNMLVVHHQASIAHNEPDTAFYVLGNDAGRSERFYRMLNRALALPILPAWTEYLWEWGVKNELITALKSEGLVAYKVEPFLDRWTDCIEMGIKQGVLR